MTSGILVYISLLQPILLFCFGIVDDWAGGARTGRATAAHTFHILFGKDWRSVLLCLSLCLLSMTSHITLLILGVLSIIWFICLFQAWLALRHFWTDRTDSSAPAALCYCMRVPILLPAFSQPCLPACHQLCLSLYFTKRKDKNLVTSSHTPPHLPPTLLISLHSFSMPLPQHLYRTSPPPWPLDTFSLLSIKRLPPPPFYT